jgi:hypothetical protein
VDPTTNPISPAAPGPKTEGKSVAALILGICSLIVPFAGPVCGILAIIFGALAMKAINAASGRLTGKPMAIIGLVLGILGLVASTVLTISVLGLFAVAALDESCLLLALPLV